MTALQWIAVIAGAWLALSVAFAVAWARFFSRR